MTRTVVCRYGEEQLKVKDALIEELRCACGCL